MNLHTRKVNLLFASIAESSTSGLRLWCVREGKIRVLCATYVMMKLEAYPADRHQ